MARGLRSSKPSAVALWAGLAGAVALVLSFPVMLIALSGLSWDQLADMGDAYGGASALLSAIALCGVGISLISQQRQVRQEMVMIRRQQHFELVRLGIEDVELMGAVDERLAHASDARQQAYLNLMTNYWLAMWELDEIDADELRQLASSIFRGESGRRWWEQHGEGWIGTRGRPGRPRFIEILTEVWASESAAAAARSTAD
jgi:hypothetical protein